MLCRGYRGRGRGRGDGIRFVEGNERATGGGEDDAEDDALMALVRAWNRAPVSVREEFAELMADSAMSVIEA